MANNVNVFNLSSNTISTFIVNNGQPQNISGMSNNTPQNLAIQSSMGGPAPGAFGPGPNYVQGGYASGGQFSFTINIPASIPPQPLYFYVANSQAMLVSSNGDVVNSVQF